MILRVDNEEVVFNVYRGIKLPRHYEDPTMISVVETNEPAIEPSAFKEDALEKAFMLFIHSEHEEEVEEMLQILDASCEYIREGSQFERLDRPIGPPSKPSVEEAPKLELKPLPSHLHYAFLGSSNTLPMIVSFHSSKLQEEKLLRVLKEHKHAISWTMSDIKGISPAFCMHKILMEEGHMRSAEHQRHLNPIIKEVVRKEVIMWLDADCYCPKDEEKITFTCPYGTYAFKGMLFGLCNAPATFQRCVMAIFTDMVERCEETNLVLNWEKRHFMVHECIVLGHKVSKDGLEVEKANVEAIENLIPPISVKEVRSFLGLLEKDVLFQFDDACLKVFEELKKKFETRNHVTECDVIKETFLDEQLLTITAGEVQWYAYFVNYLASGEMFLDLEPYAKKKLLRYVRSFMWDEPFLINSCLNLS
ncbi:uncharacterized protein [Nicotiana sylvestris]|uniref:uncharacterized protein n=1 Tax=Nicotiana sylvestris TaxID=4096 RepID=UPI00388C81E1